MGLTPYGAGAITILTDSKGEVAQRYDYDAFGNATHHGNKVKQPYAYTGREWDKETGLHYYRARYYDPKAGRFTQKDPIGFAGGDVNLYSYVGQNPGNWVDPAGLAACTVLFPDYPIDTGFGFTSTNLGGHGGVLSYDAHGSTSYYEFGRYSPIDPYAIGDKRPANEGNVRRVTVPDLVIDPKTGQPTPASLEALKNALSERVGHKTETDLTCDKDADEKKVDKYAKDFANNKKRPPYSWVPWSSNQCRDFMNRAFGAGK